MGSYRCGGLLSFFLLRYRIKNYNSEGSLKGMGIFFFILAVLQLINEFHKASDVKMKVKTEKKQYSLKRYPES